MINNPKRRFGFSFAPNLAPNQKRFDGSMPTEALRNLFLQESAMTCKFSNPSLRYQHQTNSLSVNFNVSDRIINYKDLARMLSDLEVEKLTAILDNPEQELKKQKFTV